MAPVKRARTPRDPLAGVLVLAALAACEFHRTSAIDDAAPGDATTEGESADGAIDAPPDAAAAFCGSDAALLVCFSFDAPALGSSLPNEGRAAINAALANVTRIGRGSGGAAQVDTTSQIRLPPNALTQNIVSAEVWVRIDADPPVGSRVGIMDADATSSAASFFYYFPSPGHQLRFELGQQLFLDRDVVLGTWLYLAQVCDANTLTAYLDGKPIGTRSGCTPGNATTYGLQLGQNNTQTAGNEWLTGALDGVRLWTVPLSAAAICQTAGRTDC